MDLASTVYSLTVGIVKFVSEHENKDSLVEQISNIAFQIQNVITPLRLRDISDLPLKHILETLQGVLTTIENHLRTWKESRSHRLWALVNPWAVTDQLKEDREQLMHQYIMLVGAIQVVEFIRGYNLLASTGETGPSEQNPSRIERNEASIFWHRHVGNDLDIVKSDEFCNYISQWIGRKLSSIARDRLLLRLDENRTGYVTFPSLQDLVKCQKMKDIIRSYTADPCLPLLVWVDDDVVGNSFKVKYAQKCGVTVVQLASTSSAKAWIKVNQVFLKKYDSPSDLRFITDQVRQELNSEGKLYKNWSAGNEITKYIRRSLFQAPILVYTGKRSLHRTTYVTSFPATGSLSSNYKAYQRYVSALGKRRSDDTDWIKFGGEN